MTASTRARLVYLLGVADVVVDLFVIRFDVGKAQADVARAPLDLVLRGLSFFAARFRCHDWFTSSKASAIRSRGALSREAIQR